MKNINNHIIATDTSLHGVLEVLNGISHSTEPAPLNLFVVDENECIQGSVTDGDVRRGLLNGYSLDADVSSVMNSNFYHLRDGQYQLNKLQKFREEKIDLLPVVRSDGSIKDIINLTQKESLLPVDAILMAGGEGKRLLPLTKDTPKPLLKVGEKPIIDFIIDRIDEYGISNLKLSVRYLADQIITYINGIKDKWDLDINIIRENKPLGTIGSLSLMDDFKHDTILLSNADLLSTINYESFYKFFLETNADVAVASIPYNVQVPYGIFETNGTKILSIQEKPEYSYFSNGGIYLMKRELLSKIPRDEYLDMTDFLKLLLKENHRLTYFRMLGYWQDIGTLKDFEKVQKDINLIDV